MQRNLVKNLSINTVQLFINQLFGLAIFYVLSTHLDKNSFGQINLVLAILLAAFNMLSLGIDQLVVKKIASGDDVRETLTLYSFHVLISGFAFYSLIMLGYWLFPLLITPYKILLFIGIGKLSLFFATPFKQAANGLERFKLTAIASIISNVVRGAALLLCMWLHILTLQTVIIIFIAGDVAEFIFSVLIFNNRLNILPAFKLNVPAYINLVKTALPQAGVVIITSAMARFDWIFIGLFLSASKLAEYSFAYKVYELSSAPLLALGPLLIPRFTKMIKDDTFSTSESGLLIRTEMIVAALTILVLNICWSPIIDSLTGGKYGAVNQYTIFILSLSTPLVYLNNFFWTMYFAQGRLKMILHSFILAVTVNIGLDLLLIPFYKNEGAALAILISLSAQFLFFLSKNQLKQINESFYSLIVCTVCAVFAGYIASLLLTGILPLLAFSVLLFTLLLFITRQLTLKDGKKFMLFLKA
jgi:O-antigen/teichoic acid export membrane protein